MTRLSDAQASAWLRDAGLSALEDTWAGRRGDDGFHVDIEAPNEATAAVALSHVLLLTDAADFVPAAFRGGLLWLRRWEIWSEEIDSAGYAMLCALRGEVFTGSELKAAPATMFGPGEFTAATAALTLPMLFQWDAVYWPIGGSFNVVLSHEGGIQIRVPTASGFDVMRSRLEPWSNP